MVASRSVNSVSRFKRRIANRPAMIEENIIVCSQKYPDQVVTFVVILTRDQGLSRLSTFRVSLSINRSQKLHLGQSLSLQ
jgi:hypothetical protein